MAPQERERELAHIAALCERFSVALPQAGVRQFGAQLGPVRFKWERHGESRFSPYSRLA